MQERVKKRENRKRKRPAILAGRSSRPRSSLRVEDSSGLGVFFFARANLRVLVKTSKLAEILRLFGRVFEGFQHGNLEILQ